MHFVEHSFIIFILLCIKSPLLHGFYIQRSPFGGASLPQDYIQGFLKLKGRILGNTIKSLMQAKEIERPSKPGTVQLYELGSNPIATPPTPTFTPGAFTMSPEMEAACRTATAPPTEAPTTHCKLPSGPANEDSEKMMWKTTTIASDRSTTDRETIRDKSEPTTTTAETTENSIGVEETTTCKTKPKSTTTTEAAETSTTTEMTTTTTEKTTTTTEMTTSTTEMTTTEASTTSSTTEKTTSTTEPTTSTEKTTTEKPTTTEAPPTTTTENTEKKNLTTATTEKANSTTEKIATEKLVKENATTEKSATEKSLTNKTDNHDQHNQTQHKPDEHTDSPIRIIILETTTPCDEEEETVTKPSSSKHTTEECEEETATERHMTTTEECEEETAGQARPTTTEECEEETTTQITSTNTSTTAPGQNQTSTIPAGNPTTSAPPQNINVTTPGHNVTTNVTAQSQIPQNNTMTSTVTPATSAQPTPTPGNANTTNTTLQEITMCFAVTPPPTTIAPPSQAPLPPPNSNNTLQEITMCFVVTTTPAPNGTNISTTTVNPNINTNTTTTAATNINSTNSTTTTTVATNINSTNTTTTAAPNINSTTSKPSHADALQTETCPATTTLTPNHHKALPRKSLQKRPMKKPKPKGKLKQRKRPKAKERPAPPQNDSSIMVIRLPAQTATLNRVVREIREKEQPADDMKMLTLVRYAGQPKWHRYFLRGLKTPSPDAEATDGDYSEEAEYALRNLDKHTRGSKDYEEGTFRESGEEYTAEDDLGNDEASILEDMMRMRAPQQITSKPPAPGTGETCDSKHHDLQHFKEKPKKVSVALSLSAPEPITLLPASPMVSNVRTTMQPPTHTCKPCESQEQTNNDDDDNDELLGFGAAVPSCKPTCPPVVVKPMARLRTYDECDPMQQKLSFLGRLFAEKRCPGGSDDTSFETSISNLLKPPPKADKCHQKVSVSDMIKAKSKKTKRKERKKTHNVSVGAGSGSSKKYRRQPFAPHKKQRSTECRSSLRNLYERFNY